MLDEGCWCPTHGYTEGCPVHEQIIVRRKPMGPVAGGEEGARWVRGETSPDFAVWRKEGPPDGSGLRSVAVPLGVEAAIRAQATRDVETTEREALYSMTAAFNEERQAKRKAQTELAAVTIPGDDEQTSK